MQRFRAGAYSYGKSGTKIVCKFFFKQSYVFAQNKISTFENVCKGVIQLSLKVLILPFKVKNRNFHFMLFLPIMLFVLLIVVK